MAQIEFDEGSGTFPFFVVLLYGLFLLVLTYFLWPRSKKGERTKCALIGKLLLLLLLSSIVFVVVALFIAEDRGRVCQCAPCCQKRNKVEKRRTLDKLLKFLR